MARGRPFLFCRYSLRVGDEELAARAQLVMLQELQGKAVVHSRSSEADVPDTLLMRPREMRIEGHRVFTWSVGHRIGNRVTAAYDERADQINVATVTDPGVRYADFVAVPNLHALAVDDRSGDIHVGGRQAINRLRSVLRLIDDAEIDVLFEATPNEVQRALRRWSLTRFNFTIRPNNPRPVTRLASALGDQMKRDGIGKLTGRAIPLGASMHMSDEGFIAATAGLVEAGYGQLAVAGITEDGLQAEIKKPRFADDPATNERQQEKPRELRVYVDDDALSEEQILRTAALSLIKVHSNE